MEECKWFRCKYVDRNFQSEKKQSLVLEFYNADAHCSANCVLPTKLRALGPVKLCVIHGRLGHGP